MQELVLVTNQLNFQNEELAQSVLKLRSYFKNVNQSFLQIAFELKIIKDNELYREDGYSSVVDFAEQILKFNKSTTYRAIQVADKFLINEGTVIRSVFAAGTSDFSFNQLREFLALDRRTLDELVDSRRLTPSMTVKQIRDLIDKEKNSRINGSRDVATGENNGNILPSGNLFSEETSSSLADTTLPEIISSDSESSISSTFSFITSDSTIIDVQIEEVQSSTTEEPTLSESPESVENAPRTNETTLPEQRYQDSQESDVVSQLKQRLGYEEEPIMDFSTMTYEFRFYNCRTDEMETRPVDKIELGELIFSQRDIPKEVVEYIDLLNKEIARLKNYGNRESAQLAGLIVENEELKEEVTRLQGEMQRLSESASQPRRRGRPKGSKNKTKESDTSVIET